MIKKIPYKDIDFQKYANCLAKANQKNFYAQKEILDSRCENWELLVYKDYQAIMPIPFKKKLGIQVVIMPLFCQQLGVFSEIDCQEINEEFLQYLQREYPISFYAFNEKNKFYQTLEQKKNYVIPITEYAILRKNYFKGRKSTVKSAQNLTFKSLIFDKELAQFILQHFKGLQKKSDAEKYINYLWFLDSKSILKVYGSFLQEKLISLALIIEQPDNLILLGLINHEKYTKENGASFLIDKILKENIHNKSFDFMGGSVTRGIEIFFKSFGAQLSRYSTLQNSKKELIFGFFNRW